MRHFFSSFPLVWKDWKKLSPNHELHHRKEQIELVSQSLVCLVQRMVGANYVGSSELKKRLIWDTFYLGHRPGKALLTSSSSRSSSTTPAHNRCGSDSTPKSHVRFFGRAIRSAPIMRRLVEAWATSSALKHENAALVAYFINFKRKSSPKKGKEKNSKKHKIEPKIIF